MSESTRLYRWYDADGTLLYVGISVSPSERAHAHITKSRWNRWALRMEIGDEYATREAALVAESRAIREESPIFNITGAVGPWDRINSYLVGRGEEPIVLPERERRAFNRSTRWPASISAVTDIGGEFMQRLTSIEEALAELLEDIETTPDPLVASEMSGVAARLVYETADKVSAVRARIVCGIYEEGGVSYADLAKMLGVTRMRAHQIVAAARRQEGAA